MNPTLRGFVLIALVSGAIVALQAESALVAASILLQVAFVIVAGFVLYRLWRERRSEIETWPVRAKTAFYAAPALMLADIGAYWYARPTGTDALAFFLVLGISGFAMFRIWRDQHTYL
jgi:cytochrome c oxidase assembly factor CtaG